MDRRTFIQGSAVALSAATLGARIAQAQNKQIAVANWGGDWNDRTVKFIEAPLLESKGFTIVRDLNASPERLTKMLAERRLPRGTTDINHFTEGEAFLLNSNDALETLDYSKIGNAKSLLPDLRKPYFLPWLYSSFEIVYNPNKIAEPPTSFADLANPKYKGKVGVQDISWALCMQAASLTASGKMNDFEGAKAKTLELKAAVEPKVYTGPQQIAAAYKSEEIWITANWRSRGLQWQNDGLNVAVAYPKEGGLALVYGAVMPKRASNKEGAYAYMDAMLDPAAMSGLCAANFYAPANSAVKLSSELSKRIAYTAVQQANLRYGDNAAWATNQAIWLDWWKKSFLG